MDYKDLTYAYIKKGMRLSEHQVSLLSEYFKDKYITNRLKSIEDSDVNLLEYEIALLSPEQKLKYEEKKQTKNLLN